MKLETIGKNIDMIRKERGFSLERLSKESGISYPSVARHVNGHAVPDIQTIARYAEALGCTISDLTDKATDRTRFTLETDITHVYPYNLVCAVMQCGADMDARQKAAWDTYIPGLMDALGTCRGRECEVLELRYKNAMTLREAGQAIGLSQERVRQIEARALRHLRHSTIKRKWSISAREDEAADMFSAEKERLLKELAKKEEEIRSLSDGKDASENKDIDLNDLEISTRLYNCLKKAGINSLNDLGYVTEKEIMQVRNFGERCFRELEGVMKEYDTDFMPEPKNSRIDIRMLTCRRELVIRLRKAGIMNAYDVIEDRGGRLRDALQYWYGNDTEAYEAEIKKKANAAVRKI